MSVQLDQETFTRADVDMIVAYFRRKLDRAAQPRRSHRGIVIVLLAALPIAFAVGRGTADRGLTIRQAEAAPVAAPRELPLGITRFHDVAYGVTCWRANPGSTNTPISCLPDQWLLTARDDGLDEEPAP